MSHSPDQTSKQAPNERPSEAKDRAENIPDSERLADDQSDAEITERLKPTGSKTRARHHCAGGLLAFDDSDRAGGRLRYRHP